MSSFLAQTENFLPPPVQTGRCIPSLNPDIHQYWYLR